MDDFLAWLTGLVLAFMPGHDAGPPRYLGYLEADLVEIAAEQPGRLEEVLVAEGEPVDAGHLLFVLEDAVQTAALAAAEARVKAAEASLENQMSGGREEELAVTRQALERARTDMQLAQQNFDRTAKLFDDGLVPRARRDQDEAALSAAKARVAETEAQLTVAQLPARSAMIEAARADVQAARAERERQALLLDQRRGKAKAAAIVDRVNFEAGEVVGSGQPVVALYEPDRLEARFFVPEPVRAEFSPGTPVIVECDGCGDGLTAIVTRIASEAQHTPPVIYSREERADLVYLVKARFPELPDLRPGQPVSVGLLP